VFGGSKSSSCRYSNYREKKKHKLRGLRWPWKGLEMTRKACVVVFFFERERGAWAVVNLVRLYTGLFSRPITSHDSPEKIVVRED
jgi:hypothetical protein